MATSEPKADRRLRNQLLVLMACRLGPALDQVDVDDHGEGLKVRDLILELTKPEGPSPTAIRGALMDLVDLKLVFPGPGTGEDLLGPDTKVRLRVRGLLAARRIQPECGRPLGCVTLRMKPWKRYGVFGAWLDTGVREKEREVNKPGLNLAAFYVLGVLQPKQTDPLWLMDCPWMFARLAHVGVGVKSGPGIRIMPSQDAISVAFERVQEFVRLIELKDEDDKRRRGWYLANPFPEVRIVGAAGSQFRDWAWMRENLRLTLRGRPFPDKRHQEVRPLTDEQCRELEKETLRKHRRPKGRHRKGERVSGDPEFYSVDRITERRGGGWGSEASSTE